MRIGDAELHNAVEVLRGPETGELVPCRIPGALRAELNENARGAATATAGVEIRFNLAGEKAKATLRCPDGPALVEVWRGPFMVRAQVVGAEPAAVRLNLMRHRYGETLGSGPQPGAMEADAARKELARWRELVVRWARSPSGPMSRRYADAVNAAFADDLDTATALREMAALADDAGVPDGVKFETFAAADRLFGLDLARDVGRY